MDAITQYIYATRNAFISEAIRFVAQTFVCATESTERAVGTLWIKMAAGYLKNYVAVLQLCAHYP